MATAKKQPTAAAKKDTVVSSSGDTELVMRTAEASDRPVQKAGEAGPPSSLETRVGSPTGASAGGQHNFEGRRGEGASNEKAAIEYDVQLHDDDFGVQIKRVSAKSGDEAAQKVLAGHGYKGASIRGVTPASDPDPNSLGGERDASIMIHNAENPLGGVDPLGTEANRKATEELGKKDIEELGE
jgi:hypothetical protein